MGSVILQYCLKRKWILLLLTFAFIGGVLVMTKGHEWGDDFALYLSQAFALIKGNTQELAQYNTWSMQHSDGTLGPYLYPPGYPLFLSIYLKFLPFNWLGIKIFQWLFYILGIVAFYKLLQNCQYKLPPIAILFLVMLAIMHPKYIQFADRLMSDLWFIVTVFLFFYFLYSKEYSNVKRILFVGIALILASLTRVNGFLLLGSWLIKIVLDQNDKKLKFQEFLAFIPFTLLVFYIKNVDSKYEANHLDILSSISVESCIENLRGYLSELLNFPHSSFTKILPAFAFNFVTILLGIGVILCFIYAIKSKEPLFYFAPVVFWIVVNFAIVVIWPIMQGTRYLLPIVPFFFWIVLVGFQNYLQQSRFQFFVNKIYFLLIALIFLQFAATVVMFGFIESRNDVIGQTQNDIYLKIRETVNDDDVIAFDKPRWLHLVTNKRVIRKSVDSTFFNSQAKYLLHKKNSIYGGRPKYINDQRLDSVYSNRDFILYKRNDLKSK